VRSNGNEEECKKCRKLEKKLLISESKIVNLMLENYKLKRAFNALQGQSISVINPA